MAEVQYVIEKRSLKVKGVKEDRYLPKLVSSGRNTTKDIAKKSIIQGTISDLEFPQFIDMLVRTIKEDLKSGLRVQLGDLGTLVPTITCKAVKSFDDLDMDAVKKKTVRFQQSLDLKTELKKVSFRKSNIGTIKHM
ncbi:MAG: hypothetical protein IJ759_02805 [Bacteroidales bacterium]|nr:hypothetical protein [Bacteroidales bacterium]